jgi:hypothetical protein
MFLQVTVDEQTRKGVRRRCASEDAIDCDESAGEQVELGVWSERADGKSPAKLNEEKRGRRQPTLQRDVARRKEKRAGRRPEIALRDLNCV